MLIGRSGGPLGNAYILPLDPQIDANGEHYIPISYHFPLATGGSLNDDSALVKPFKKVLNDGKPIGKTAFVFYHDKGSYFILASFANNKRTLFFPGLTLSRVVHTSEGKDLTGEVHNIDHFTLEENLIDWHVTLYQKRNQGTKYPKLKTKEVNTQVFLWFVMAIRDVRKLQLMPKIQEYELRAANTRDLRRRLNIMLQSTEGNNFPVAEINYHCPPPYFINFEFFISPKKIELDLPEELFVLPISKLDEMKQGIRSRSHDFSLNQNLSISIRVSKIKGSLEYDAVFFPGGSYAYPHS